MVIISILIWGFEVQVWDLGAPSGVRGGQGFGVKMSVSPPVLTVMASSAPGFDGFWVCSHIVFLFFLGGCNVNLLQPGTLNLTT